jgi:O-antigen ligase
MQLWILAWLGGKLIDKPYKNWWIFILFIIAADISAIVSFKNGFVGATISDSVRSEGLTEGINTAARYYVLALLFTYFVFSTRRNHKKWVGFFSAGSSIILILGLTYTLSRTGFALVPVLAGLIIIQPNFRNKEKWLFLLLGIGTMLVFVPDNAFNIAGSKILPSILQGTDTIGTRYRIWEAGLKMFLDHPIAGVGIGQFSNYVHNYSISGIPNYLNLSTHNLYIQILSETGIVGFLIFLTIIIYTIKLALKKAFSTRNSNGPIDWIWLSVIVVILIGGLTKSDFADKFIWIALGITFQPSRNNTILNN